ncbi:ABC transporter permease subunit [Neobacillus sp. SuZ13]|uniref:ABC transporter permease subunit n=1 Tax=Neobacillus sp. SuZ13 TaxID=3047875 RepID=UPI0024BF7FEE|nr:ABC transporter permease subunit [Neobacillus sp. SuZ13]WHY69154.1 ABC transporter permease subunit [Neobacillus sp. SuZ13]
MRKYKKTIIGSTFLLLLLIMSLLYPYYGPKDFNHQVLVKNEQGDIFGRAPFPPSGQHLLGTNRNGEDMHWLLLYGAKFTLISAFGVALLRVFLGGIFGIFLSMWAPFLKGYVKDFFLTFRYIPSILIAILLMIPIVGDFNDVAVSSIVTYQIIILVFIGFPSVTIFASDVTDQLLQTSFVQSSKLMGAGKLHIVRKQLMPYIRSYGILFSVQQFISTLHITMQLGLFGMFLGGRNRAGVMGYEEPPKPATITNEWAGLIGQNFSEFVRAPWAILTPVFGFFIVIVIVNMMKNELEGNLNGVKVVKEKKKKDLSPKVAAYSADQFEFVQK